MKCRQQAKWKGKRLEEYLESSNAKEEYHSLMVFIRVAFHS
jgi:hypothetical protein